MRYFPLFLDTRGRRVVIVGGGAAAANKARLAMKSEAEIRVIDPAPNEELRMIAEGHANVRLIERAFKRSDVKGAAFVYAALEDEDARAGVVRAARKKRVPVNSVDVKEDCDFITPALVDRDPLTVAISSDGHVPVLARRVKAAVERATPEGHARIARFAEAMRPMVKARLSDFDARRAFWEALVDGPAGAAASRGDMVEATRLAEGILAGATVEKTGRVTLVGAGPGDPELLTLKALRALETADVLVIDRLVGPRILDYARRDAERLFVGKTPGRPSPKQHEINALLLKHARDGKHVVRLKGGDPFIYGRAVEELETLHEAGIATEVVPGVTAATAAAAAHQIPLTRREEFRSLIFLTARGKDGFVEHDWAELAKPGQTLAVYMGVGAAATVQARLLDNGVDPATPVSVVENTSRPEEKTAVGRIDGLSDLLEAHAIKGPAVIFVGAGPLPRTSARTLTPPPTAKETPAPALSEAA